MTALFTLPKQIPVDSSGTPYGGAKLYFYRAGTTTNQSVYTTSALSVAHDQPVQADAAGVFPAIYLNHAADYDYRVMMYTSADALLHDQDSYPRSGVTGVTVLSTALKYDITAAETAAGVTPSTYVYIPGNTGPGDIARYISGSATASAVASAVQQALSAHGIAFIPEGTWNWNPVLFTAQFQRITGAGVRTRLSYSGSGNMIDFDGYAHCQVDNVRLLSATAARGIRVGNDSGDTRNAHWWKIRDVDVLGSSGGADASGSVSGFTTAGIEIVQAYYGSIFGGDIAYCTRGVYGYRECNANQFASISMRQNIRSYHLTDTTSSSDGCQITGGSIESAQAATVAGIDIEGFDSLQVHGTRMELVGGSGDHIRVRAGTGVSQYCEFHGVVMEGTDRAYTFGSGSGSSNVIAPFVVGGRSGTAWVINSDCDNLRVIGSQSHFGLLPGAGLSTYNGVRSKIDRIGNISYTAGITGLTTSPTAVFIYEVHGDVVTIYAATLNGTSNSTACTITGMPVEIAPRATRNELIRVQDNSASILGVASIATNGVITLSNTMGDTGSMTNGGTKGILSGVIRYLR